MMAAEVTVKLSTNIKRPVEKGFDYNIGLAYVSRTKLFLAFVWAVQPLNDLCGWEPASDCLDWVIRVIVYG